MNITYLGIIGLIAGGYVAWQATQDSALESKLQQEGKDTVGMIEKGTTKSRRGVKSYSFDITYAPEGGAPITKNFSVKKDFAQQYVKDDTFIKYDVPIRYAASDPQQAVVVGGTSSMAGMGPVGYSIAGVGVLLLGWGIMRRKAQSA